MQLMKTIRTIHEIELEGGLIANLRWSPDGRLLAIPTESGSIVIFEKEKGSVLRTIGHHEGRVTAVAWDRKGECILTGSVDLSIGLWRVATGERAPFTIQGHAMPVHTIEWTDEEAYAITCSADRLRVLDGACLLAGWRKEDEDRVNEVASFVVASCSRQSTFLMAFVADDGRLLRLVSLISGDILSSSQLSSSARCVAWSPAGDVLATGDDSGVSLRQCTQEGFEGAPIRLCEPGKPVRAVSFAPGGEFLAAADDDGIEVWRLRSRRRAASYLNPRSSVAPVPVFHPFEPLVAMTDPSGHKLLLLDLSDDS